MPELNDSLGTTADILLAPRAFDMSNAGVIQDTALAAKSTRYARDVIPDEKEQTTPSEIDKGSLDKSGADKWKVTTEPPVLGPVAGSIDATTKFGAYSYDRLLVVLTVVFAHTTETGTDPPPAIAGGTRHSISVPSDEMEARVDMPPTLQKCNKSDEELNPDPFNLITLWPVTGPNRGKIESKVISVWTTMDPAWMKSRPLKVNATCVIPVSMITGSKQIILCVETNIAEVNIEPNLHRLSEKSSNPEPARVINAFASGLDETCLGVMPVIIILSSNWKVRGLRLDTVLSP